MHNRLVFDRDLSSYFFFTWCTNRGVDGLPALHAAILADAVMRLAKGDAGQAPCHQAGVDGVEAAKEGRAPGLGALGRLGVDVLAGFSQDLVEAVLPVLDIAVVDGAVARLGRGGRC